VHRRYVVGGGRKTTGADEIFGYIYVFSTGTDVCAVGVDGNDSCFDERGQNINGRGRNINGRGRYINRRGRNINGRGRYRNGRGRYRNGRGREKNRRARKNISSNFYSENM
jgi:hypothetical protein